MNEKKPIRISERGNDYVKISGLSQEEVNIILGAVSETCYIGFKDNTLEVVKKFKDLPEPIDDPLMFPFWRKPRIEETAQQEIFEEFIFEKTSEHESPSISICSLCGYYYTPETYKTYGERLISYGFVCLRSKRSKDAKFWETWYLPSLWFAAGDLKDTLNSDPKNIYLAIRFIQSQVKFGTLSISACKLAQRIPED